MILLLYYCIYMINMTRQNPTLEMYGACQSIYACGYIRVFAVNRCIHVGDMYMLSSIGWLLVWIISQFKLHVAGLTSLPVRSTWASPVNDSGWERDKLTLEHLLNLDWEHLYKWFLLLRGMLHRDDSMSLASWRSYFICYLRATNNGKWESRETM